LTDSYGSCLGRLPYFSFLGQSDGDEGMSARYLRIESGGGSDGILSSGAVYFVLQMEGGA